MSVGHWPSMIRTPSLSTNRQSVASCQPIWKPSTSWKYWALRLMLGTASTKAHGAIFDCMLGDLSLLKTPSGPVRSRIVPVEAALAHHRCPCSKLQMAEKFQDFFGLRSFEQDSAPLLSVAGLRYADAQ